MPDTTQLGGLAAALCCVLPLGLAIIAAIAAHGRREPRWNNQPYSPPRVSKVGKKSFTVVDDSAPWSYRNGQDAAMIPGLRYITRNGNGESIYHVDGDAAWAAQVFEASVAYSDAPRRGAAIDNRSLPGYDVLRKRMDEMDGRGL